MNAQMALTTITAFNFLPARGSAPVRKQSKLQVVREKKPVVKRKYEPLETDGPATCLVWFD